jgi:hypothetical protein
VKAARALFSCGCNVWLNSSIEAMDKIVSCEYMWTILIAGILLGKKLTCHGNLKNMLDGSSQTKMVTIMNVGW